MKVIFLFDECGVASKAVLRERRSERGAGDSDDDGRCDNKDPYPNDPNNCHKDSDGDGVCDDEDLCQGDDGAGDSDNDGVCDDEDLCQGDDSAGDSDEDGICDNDDDCLGDDATCDSDEEETCDSDDDCDEPQVAATIQSALNWQ